MAPIRIFCSRVLALEQMRIINHRHDADVINVDSEHGDSKNWDICHIYTKYNGCPSIGLPAESTL